MLVVRIQRHKHEALIFKHNNFSVEIRSFTFLTVKDFCIIKNDVKGATPYLHVTYVTMSVPDDGYSGNASYTLHCYYMN